MMRFWCHFEAVDAGDFNYEWRGCAQMKSSFERGWETVIKMVNMGSDSKISLAFTSCHFGAARVTKGGESDSMCQQAFPCCHSSKPAWLCGKQGVDDRMTLKPITLHMRAGAQCARFTLQRAYNTARIGRNAVILSLGGFRRLNLTKWKGRSDDVWMDVLCDQCGSAVDDWHRCPSSRSEQRAV